MHTVSERRRERKKEEGESDRLTERKNSYGK